MTVGTTGMNLMLPIIDLKMVNLLRIFYHSKQKKGGHILSDMTNLFRKLKFQFGKVYPGVENMGISFHWRKSHFLELIGHRVVVSEGKKEKLK